MIINELIKLLELAKVTVGGGADVLMQAPGDVGDHKFELNDVTITHIHGDSKPYVCLWPDEEV